MASFRTELILNKAAHPLTLNDRFLSLGSCFAKFMDEELRANKFGASLEPFGTVYNPISLHKLMVTSLNKTTVQPEGFVRRGDQWFHYDFHSQFSAHTDTALLNRIDTIITETHSFLQSADCILITYGTAWVYTLRDTGAIVANCHKMPASLFYKRLLAPDEIVRSFHEVFASLKKLCPKARFILSVSPVRHLKDSLELNSLSKASLRLAVHELTTSLEDVDYFPAFELLTDDLRDYRFYADDMIHPSPAAEKYVWEKFSERYFDHATRALLAKWLPVRAALAHRPFDAAAAGYKSFLEDTLRKLNELRAQLHVEDEITSLRNQLEQL